MAHFSMNGRLNSRVEEEESSDSDHRRKRRKMGQNFEDAAPAQSSLPGAKPSKFAAKMMAKMGYVEGQGLGATGRGRLAPIETQQRPTGAGLGAVREKTKQAKEEEKREAAFRGEILEDSEEEEKKRRKELKKKRAAGVIGGPSGTPTRPKPKYRTAAEIEASAEGLEVPNVLKSIIDATGSETKLLTSTAGLMTTQNAMVAGETEAVKIARRARRDLEAFAEEWNTVSERKQFFELQETQLLQEVDEQEAGIHGLETIISAVQDLQFTELEITSAANDEILWENIITKIESLENTYADKIDTSVLQEVTVAVIHPLFKKAMQQWQPLDDPSSVSSYLSRISRLLGIQPTSSGTDIALQLDSHHHARPSKSTTPYETMLYTLFLPPLRSAITNDWDPMEPSSLLSLIQTWTPILPAFIFMNLTHNLIPTRLSILLSAWKSSKPPSKRHSQPPPHTYIFPWLPYLSPQHLSPTSPTGLFSTLKAKLKSLFQSYPLNSPPPQTLPCLLPILPRSFLQEIQTRHLLPRLSTHLSHNLLIDPSDQDLQPLTETLAWLTQDWSLSTTTTAHLLAAEFFPKWHHVLYLWLTNSPNYDEVREWFLWWKEQFPPKIREHDVMAKEWTKALETISLALDLGPEEVAKGLPKPEMGPAKPLLSSAISDNNNSNSNNINVQSRQKGQGEEEPITFRAVLEAWCADNSLLFMPLREADPGSGLPLFRITASASGKGGVVCYLRGDVVWVREGRKGGGEGGAAAAVFKPVGLDEGLLERAEGR
ncbi:MAG: hypothetical protein Q9219_004127 [cf. Caloplaca sp. 3 TL-2023]